jgi:hypothetical protein
MPAARALERQNLEGLEGSHISTLRSDREMGAENSKNIVYFETEQIRNDMLQRMAKEKGVVSKDEEEGWKKKIDNSSQNLSRLRGVNEEFNEHWQRSVDMRKKFDQKVHGADEEGMLHENEHEGLDDRFTQSKLAEKEKMLQELEKELAKRNQELSKFFKLEKVVQEKRRDSLKKAENYDEKLRVLEKAEGENKSFKEYRGLFEKQAGKIGKQTRAEYYEWFLALGEDEQAKAVGKAEKEDIQPRVEAYDTHAALPKEYQNNEFKEWGLTRRLQYLGDAERRMDREWGKGIQDSKNVLAEKSVKILQSEYEKSMEEAGPRLKRKANFQKMLVKKVEMEKKLWKDFEKFPDKIHSWLQKEFTESDFTERTEILRTKGPKLIERYTKALNKMNNKMDPQVSELYRERFDSAKTIEDMEKCAEEAQLFQKSKTDYFKKWDADAKYFRSDRTVYENYYNENVRDVQTAQKMEEDLKFMIEIRKSVYEGTQKLPVHLKARMNEDGSIEKRSEKLQKLKEVAQAYQSTIPFLLKNAEEKEKAKDFNGALQFYVQALKLDPDSPELKALAAHMTQKGAKWEGTPASEEDGAQTEEILKQVEGSSKISQQAAELAKQQILLDLSKKHAEQVGATGTTTAARAKASMKGLQKEDQETAQAVLERHGDDFTVDETGTLRKKMKIKASGQRTEEIQRQMGQLFDNKVHKGEAAQSGLSEVAFVDDSGKEMERTTAEQHADKMHDRLEESIKVAAMARIKAANVKFTPEQLKVIEKSLDFHERAKETEEEAREAI